jgi:hypothetical protein
LAAPTSLTCEFLRAPEAAVITDPTPEFSWVFPQSGLEQSACRILVASSPFLLRENQADYWDSGTIEEDRSVNISYAGGPLVGNTTYWWQVKVWSKDGLESDFCQPQQFNTGSFDRSNVAYPGESRWIELSSDYWVSEDKQCATFHRYEPEYVENSQPGVYFAGFGKSVIGILEFTATAAHDDAQIILHLGERKNADPTVHKDPGRSNIGYESVEMSLKRGTHHYVLKLAERGPSRYLHSQKLAPHYPEVMPFRYVEIRGEPGSYTIDVLKQAALFYYFDDSASEFRCTDQNLNAVWDLCKYTLKATPFLGVYADGNRERMPYEADAYIQQLGHFAVDREYAISKYTINFLLDHASWPTEWQMHMVLMAWAYYMQTGDALLLKDRYEDLKRKSLIALTEENGLISTRTGKKTQAFLDSMMFPGPMEQFRDIVDWPPGPPEEGESPANYRGPLAGGERDGYVFTDFNTVVNAFHYRSLVLMAKIAQVVGNQTDRDFFQRRSQEHLEVFQATFFDKDRGIFKDGATTDHASLHASMFPLAFEMVPAEHVPSVVKHVKSRGMACSVYGAQYLLEALYFAGEADYALGLMTSDSKRSWLNMIQVGSSMTTEAWDEYFKPNLTWNHAWGSAPANITARKLMGVEPIEPTFRRFRVAPQPGYLDSAAIRVPCIRGEIGCELRNRDDGWQMRLSVPGNTEAEVWIPGEFSQVHINGQEGKPTREIRFAGGQRRIFELKSGIFTIAAKK